MACEEEMQLRQYADYCMELVNALIEETIYTGHSNCYGCGNDLTDDIYNECLHEPDCVFLKILLWKKTYAG